MNDVQEKTNGELVSIIILFYNSAQYVEESVRSVMAQTYQNWELLFMDDNSKDKTICQNDAFDYLENVKNGIVPSNN